MANLKFQFKGVDVGEVPAVATLRLQSSPAERGKFVLEKSVKLSSRKQNGFDCPRLLRQAHHQCKSVGRKRSPAFQNRKRELNENTVDWFIPYNIHGI